MLFAFQGSCRVHAPQMRDLCIAWHTAEHQEIAIFLTPDPPCRLLGEWGHPIQFTVCRNASGIFPRVSSSSHPKRCHFSMSSDMTSMRHSDSISKSSMSANVRSPAAPLRGACVHMCVRMCVHLCAGPMGEGHVPHIRQDLRCDPLKL